MGLNTFSSDYGSGSSMNSSTSWGSQDLDWQTFQSQLLHPERPRTKAASFADLVNGRCTIEDVMHEFRMNGSDAPYHPEDDQYFTRKQDNMRSTLNPATAVYMRQKSWPAPDRTPSQRLQRPISVNFPMTTQIARNEVSELPAAATTPSEGLTEEQRRVLTSLPDAVVLTLLREMQRRNKRQPEECRFCKNNGERESYYRSHVLKDPFGCVACPVLRAFVCKRCGASGDTAHTIKYCPLSTSEERIKSAAMMRSVRLSSGRRRAPSPGRPGNYVVFGDTTDAVLADGDACRAGAGAGGGAGGGARGAGAGGGARGAPLHPLWAQLEQKLML